MGIDGLHKGLVFCTVKTNVSQYQNQKVAVDASSWLHKSVYSCSERYVASMEQQRLDERCIAISAKYIGSRCQELLDNFGIHTVYLVMDGKRCPLKADTNTDRESKRQENLREARAFQRQGQREKAQEKYKGCIKITNDFTVAVMAKVAEQLPSHRSKVEFVWSPYEADAQLAALVTAQKADVVITEVRRRRMIILVEETIAKSSIFSLLFFQLVSFIHSFIHAARTRMFLFTRPRATPVSRFCSSWIDNLENVT